MYRPHIELLQGTLDLLILQTLFLAPAHGNAIAHHIEHTSRDVLKVEHGSLYPALKRLEAMGCLESQWGVSENKRRARYYQLTKAGRKQLLHETQKWDRMTDAIGRILRPGQSSAEYTSPFVRLDE